MFTVLVQEVLDWGLGETRNEGLTPHHGATNATTLVRYVRTVECIE